MKKPIIGITCEVMFEELYNRDTAEKHIIATDYTRCIDMAGGIPVIIPMSDTDDNVERYLDFCDGFVFSGGIDVNPKLYNKDPSPYLGKYCTRLDEFQLKLLEEVLKRDKPIFAICKGLQLLNIIYGGDLHQDMSEVKNSIQHSQLGRRGETSHKVYIEKDNILSKYLGKEYYVNSYHHQAINKIGNGVKVTSRSGDGVIESAEIEDKNFVFGVQWHPEITAVKDENMLNLFRTLVEASIN